MSRIGGEGKILQNFRKDINGVFMGVFSCRCVACEAAYSQLRLHVTGKYNRQQTGISC